MATCPMTRQCSAANSTLVRVTHLHINVRVWRLCRTNGCIIGTLPLLLASLVMHFELHYIRCLYVHVCDDNGILSGRLEFREDRRHFN